MYYPRAGKFGGYREHWTYLGGFPSGYAVPALGLMWVLDNRDAMVSHAYISMLWGAAFTVEQTALTAVPEKIFPVLKPVMKAVYGSEEAAEFLQPDGKSLNWKWAAPSRLDAGRRSRPLRGPVGASTTDDEVAARCGETTDDR